MMETVAAIIRTIRLKINLSSIHKSIRATKQHKKKRYRVPTFNEEIKRKTNC